MSRLHALPQLITDDLKLRHAMTDPILWRAVSSYIASRYPDP
jgi:hypothetical protein